MAEIFTSPSMPKLASVAQGKGGGKAADQFMLAPRVYGVWAETDLNRDPDAARKTLVNAVREGDQELLGK